MRASPSGGVINLSLVMQYIAMSDRWSTSSHPSSELDFMICLSGWFTLRCNSGLTSLQLIILLVVRSTISPHQSQSMPGQIMPLRTGTARPSHKTLTTWSPRELRVKRAPGSSGNINYWHPPLSLSPDPNNVAKHVSNIISDTSHIYFIFGKKEYYRFNFCISVSPASLRWH